MHLRVMIPPDGVPLWPEEWLEALDREGIMMDVSKVGFARQVWIFEISTSILVYNFTSLTFPRKRHNRSGFVYMIDIFGTNIHLYGCV